MTVIRERDLISLAGKAFQLITGALLALCIFFLVDAFGKMNELAEKVIELDKRVTILEYENGRTR